MVHSAARHPRNVTTNALGLINARRRAVCGRFDHLLSSGSRCRTVDGTDGPCNSKRTYRQVTSILYGVWGPMGKEVVVLTGLKLCTGAIGSVGPDRICCHVQGVLRLSYDVKYGIADSIDGIIPVTAIRRLSCSPTFLEHFPTSRLLSSAMAFLRSSGRFR